MFYDKSELQALRAELAAMRERFEKRFGPPRDPATVVGTWSPDEARIAQQQAELAQHVLELRSAREAEERERQTLVETLEATALRVRNEEAERRRQQAALASPEARMAALRNLGYGGDQ